MKRIVRSLAVLILLAVALYWAATAPAHAQSLTIPHDKAGYESCLTCHGPAGAKPFPTDHQSFQAEMCLSCHSFAAVKPVSESSGTDCLSCHGQPGLTMKLASGETLDLYVDSKTFSSSVHGEKLLCTDCHTSIQGYPHPVITVATVRDYHVGQYETCKQCHFANYTKTLDSVHYKVFSDGNRNAPLCTDCHGAHNVGALDTNRAKISSTCATCHEGIVNQYVQSVHGKALVEENNFDVPACTDCHKSHLIDDPRTAAFRIQSVELCSKCHSDAKIMQKYGISTNVVQSYLQDFHGSTVALTSQQSKDIWVNTAVCTDCHGVHDISVVNDPNSHVIKANLQATCAKCHPGSNINFPGAWLSHYQPSVTKAPLVFATQWFYRLMIPFIIVGLSIHVLLDLWRTLTNR